MTPTGRSGDAPRLLPNENLLTWSFLRPLPRDRQHERPPPAVVAVLVEVDPLPRPESQFAVADGNRKTRVEKRCLDVSRHVVGAFDRMVVVGLVLRHHLVEMILHIGAYVRTGVFVDRKRRRRVLDVDVKQAGPHIGQVRQGPTDLCRNEMEAPGSGVERERGLSNHHRR